MELDIMNSPFYRALHSASKLVIIKRSNLRKGFSKTPRNPIIGIDAALHQGKTLWLIVGIHRKGCLIRRLKARHGQSSAFSFSYTLMSDLTETLDRENTASGSSIDRAGTSSIVRLFRRPDDRCF